MQNITEKNHAVFKMAFDRICRHHTWSSAGCSSYPCSNLYDSGMAGHWLGWNTRILGINSSLRQILPSSGDFGHIGNRCGSFLHISYEKNENWKILDRVLWRGAHKAIVARNPFLPFTFGRGFLIDWLSYFPALRFLPRFWLMPFLAPSCVSCNSVLTRLISSDSPRSYLELEPVICLGSDETIYQEWKRVVPPKKKERVVS